MSSESRWDLWGAIGSWRKRADGRQVASGGPNVSPPGGVDFEVQQVQQNHKRPCLQEVSEFLKVQQKCNMKCNVMRDA